MISADEEVYEVIYLYALLGFVIFFLLMALGVILSRKPLRGSCGGMRRLIGNSSPCEICGAPPEEQDKCPKRQEEIARSAGIEGPDSPRSTPGI
ncbi:(Na+)-NQR maturation NqrM [Oligoflexus tunisiensis]|uniref:(Na+)-NQR maturation NqrM n=1 Tax=Oligoflexus tunisiensis TaxID=708132 RepID=UPI001C4030E7|nr:(Na+)-NQR maturation NqrM [Oligoflexus tunisiensis]